MMSNKCEQISRLFRVVRKIAEDGSADVHQLLELYKLTDELTINCVEREEFDDQSTNI